MVSEEVGVADSLRDVRGNRNDPVYAGLCIAEFDDRRRRSTSIFSCFASHPGQMSRLAFPSSSFTSHPERYSGGKLHNSPPLLSHVCPAALSFDGYVTPWAFQTPWPHPPAAGGWTGAGDSRLYGSGRFTRLPPFTGSMTMCFRHTS